MESSKTNVSFRVLILITSPKLADKAAKLYRKGSVPIHYRLNGMGTATSEMLDLLGIGSSDKGILISVMPKNFADKMLSKLYTELRLGVPGNGVGFTLPLSGANSHILKMIQQHSEDNMDAIVRKENIIMFDEIKNILIAVVANRGYSEEVMTAAKAAGARGGTIVHARRMGKEEAMSFWGFSLQEEKEMILIIANNETKMPIMHAISEKCGIRSEAQGIVMSLPIDTVIGLTE